MQASADSALHCSFWCLEQPGDVAVAVSAEVGELDRLSLSRIKRCERGADSLGLREVEHATLDVVERDTGLDGIASLAVAPCGLCAQQVDGPPVYLREEERAQRAAVRIEAVGVVPHPEVDLLHHLLGQRSLDQDTAREPEARVTVTAIDLRERVLIARRDGADELRVVELVDRFRRVSGVDGPSIPRRPSAGERLPRPLGSGHAGCSASRRTTDDTLSTLLAVPRPTAFDWPPEADAARGELEAFLDQHAPGGAWPFDWSSRLAQAGYVAPHWPEPWGRSAGPWEQLAIDDAMRARQVPRPLNPIGIGWAGPTLLVAGTDEQQRRFLPGLLDGSDLWCQLFSEPGAGSDLASLQTRAVRDGDEYVVNGQKVWTTLAHIARYGILLARTRFDRAVADQESISYFVLDMHSPGVTVRPIVQMTGTHEFNEVFFDDVRVPSANLIGAEHDGWRLAKVTLGNERVSLSAEGALWGRGPTANDVIDLVRAHGGCDDPVRRQQLAALYVESEVLRLIRLRTLSARVRGLEPGPEASVRKALSDEHGQRVMRTAIELAGTDGLLGASGPFGEASGMWTYGFLYSPALTIGGGTGEVQRNIIAERVLGLPKDPQVAP